MIPLKTFSLYRRRNEDRGTSCLVHYFEDFYVSLLNYKGQLHAHPEKDTPHPPEDFSGLPSEQPKTLSSMDSSSPNKEKEELTAPAISSHLKSVLEKMALDVHQKGGEYGDILFKEALFVMAAFADEFFLTLPWEGQSYWQDHLLESTFFGTHDAGDVFFKNLDSFLKERDPMGRDLAQVYLMALGLGFQGKYRDTPDQHRLKSYGHQLYLFIYHQELPEHTMRLFPENYQLILEEGQLRYTQDIRQWRLGLSALFLFLLMASAVAWISVTAPLTDLLDRILNRTLSSQQEKRPL